MSSELPPLSTTLGSPSTYHIRVLGQLDEKWANRLGGLHITSVAMSSQVVVTSLRGALVDQAALFGVLNSLYHLGFPLLTVECLSEPSSALEVVNDSAA